VEQSESIGLFLGAGASFELGMPLVRGLTGEFKGYFTPEHLRELNAGWREQGGGCDNSVIETTAALLNRGDLHYENILGHLETASRRPHEPFAEQYGALYQRMVELVYLLLYPRQAESLPYIERGLPPFEGLAGFVSKSSPVWAFSLNHDLMIQLLATHCRIPLRDGFWPDKTLTIFGNQPGVPRASLLADVLSEGDLNQGNLHLFRPGEFGINLLKIHGALDIFAFRDGLDLCRLRPVDSALGGHLAALRIVNEEIGYWDHAGKARIINELAYTDESGQEQFLQRTLLAGAQKFNMRFSQRLPQKILDIFRSHINYVQKLYVVGYSFGDAHIDLVLRNWLEFSGARSIVIVDPRRKDIPAHLSHLALQIELKNQTAGEFFAGYREEPMTPFQKLEQKDRAARRPAFEELAAKKW
jgi:hypothetical protein